MIHNLLFTKIEKHSKQTFIVVFCFITNSVFAQNPLFLKEIISNDGSSGIRQVVATTSGKVFFNTVNVFSQSPDSWGLWASDGTSAGTKKLTLSNGNHNTLKATMLRPLGNNKVIFTGDNEGGYGEMWVSDGTQGGTFLLESFTSGVDAPLNNIASIGNTVIYYARDNNQHLTLRKTDGTLAGTGLVHDFGLNVRYMPINSPFNQDAKPMFGTLNNILYFEMVSNTNYHGELWRTDGTDGGTFMVKDLTDYILSDLMPVGNSFYFITNSSSGVGGDYLWKSDGTSTGTLALKQISASSKNSFPSFASVSAILYFVGDDGVHGKELWKTDGTAAGTGMTFDFNPGATGSNPQWLTVLNDQLYFSATSSIFPGTNLYSYNGTQFSPPIQQNNLSNPANLAVVNNTIVFSGLGSTFDGNELWFSGGSTPNTLEISNINAAANASSNPSLFSVSGNNVYFAASYDVNRDGIDEPCIFKFTIPEKIWTGNVSADASNADNWFPSGAPKNTDNVLLPVNAINPITKPFLFCHDLYNNGGRIDVQNGLVLINGNFFNSGIVNNPSSDGTYYPGVFGMASSGSLINCTFGNTGTFNGQLTLSSNVNLHLTTSANIEALRVEGADSIFLGAYQLTVNKFPIFQPTIVLDENSVYSMQVGYSPVTFPISAFGSYTPVTLTNHGTPGYFNVSMRNGVYSNGTSGNAVTQQAVNKTWLIEPALPGNYNVDITLQWDAADELPGFDRSHIYLNHYTNGAWDNGTQGTASGTGPYTFSRNGIMSFSPFTVSSSTSALPVNLVSFTANKSNNAVQLNWQTVSEKNFSFFGIERSNDGIIFSSIGEVPVSFNNTVTKNYSYTDNSPISGTNFYRLKMVDADAKFTYSKIVAVRFDGNNNTLQLFPNPAKDILNVQVTGNDNNALLQIIDMSGRKIMERKIALNGTTSLPVDIRKISKGTYTLLLKGNSVNEQKKFVKE